MTSPQEALQKARELDGGWQPIETAPEHERVMVAGWNEATKRVQGYWWWHEDVIFDGKAFDHPEATLWCPIILPPFPPASSSSEETP